MILYDNIHDYRILKGWSQDELARRAGYRDRSMITRIEKGSVDLPHSKVLLFASIFNVDPVDLMGLSDSAANHTTQPVPLPSDEQQLLTGYRKLDQADKGQVCDMVHFLLSKDKYKQESSCASA